MTSKQALYTELLVLRSQRGDRDALEELVRLWEKPLHYYVRRLVADDERAGHVMQEAWFRMLRGIGRLKDAKSFAAWAYTIARATAMDHMRDEYARQMARLDEGTEPADNGTDDADALDSAEQVHSGLAKLPLPYREILTLFFLQDLAIDEIAGVLGIPAGTVKSRLHYAKKAMKAILTDSNKENVDE